MCPSKMLAILTEAHCLHIAYHVIHADLSINEIHKVKQINTVLYSQASLFNKLHYVINKVAVCGNRVEM